MIYLAAINALTFIAMALILKVVLDGRERAEAAWSEERRDLLLRIQAPEVAVTRVINEEAEPGPEAIDMSDGPNADDSYWQSREETVDELAERLMAEETRG